MDKLEAMRRFVLVANSGSFTKAAESLGLPKSSISSAIQGLENSLGTRLFHRSTRSVRLTQDGDAYLPQCRDILAELDALESQFQHTQDEVKGVLRVDMPSRFASTVVLPHLHDFSQTYPRLQFKISSADHRVDLVKEGIDCAIRVGKLFDSSLIAKPLTQYRIINCVSPRYAQLYGVPDSLEALSRHRLIDYSPLLKAGDAMFEYFINNQLHHYPMASSLAVNGTDAYLSACLHGLGIAQIPAMGVIEYLKSGQLISFLPQYEAEPMPVNVLYPSRRQLPKRLVLFMEWLHALMINIYPHQCGLE